jgi:hypothetical protein
MDSAGAGNLKAEPRLRKISTSFGGFTPDFAEKS